MITCISFLGKNRENIEFKARVYLAFFKILRNKTPSFKQVHVWTCWNLWVFVFCKTFKIKKVRKIDLRYTEDLIEIKDIVDGIIITKENKLLKIFEIDPAKLLLLEKRSKNNLFVEWGEWLKNIPNQIQIKIISQRTDIESFLIEQKNNYKNENENANVKKLIENNLEFTRRISYNNSIDKKFYMVYPYVKANFSEIDSLEEELRDFKIQIEYVKQDLLRFGVKAIEHENMDAAVASLIYNYTNRTTKEYVSLNKRLDRLSEDIRKVYNLKLDENLPYIESSTLVAPLNLDSEKSKEYVIIDGKYQMTLAVASNSYPDVISDSWFNMFINLGDNIDIDFFIKKEDESAFLTKTARKINVTSIQARNKTAASLDSEEVSNRLNSCIYISNSIKKKNGVFYINMLITIHGDTKKELFDTKKEIMKMLGTPYQLLSLKSMQLEAFKSILPLNNLHKRIFERSKQNMVTADLCLCYPFITHKLSDKNGYMLGINGYDNSVIMIDNFDTKKYVNSNMLIVGTTGSGKTFTLLTVLTRMRLKGINCYVIAPDKQDEFRRVTDALGGAFVNMSSSSKDRINIFEIRPQAEPDIAIVGEHYEADSLLTDKIQQINIFFSLVIPDIEIQESAYLNKTLKSMYLDFGITEDNESIYLDPNNPDKGLKEMPIMENLYQKILDTIDSAGLKDKRLVTVIEQFITGSYTYFNGHTNINLDNKMIVFGLEKMEGSPLLAPAMFIALDFIWNKVKEDKTQRKMIFIDEVWQLLSTKTEKAAQLVKRIAKVIRGWGGGALFATQQIVDMMNEYGEAVIGMSNFKLLLYCDERDRKPLIEPIGLSADEYDLIGRFQKGQGLFCIGTQHLAINILASEKEKELFSTDILTLKKMVEKRKEKEHDE